MSTLELFDRTPFDVFVRNFFQDANKFAPIDTQKIPHPIDVYEVENGLGIDIACTGLHKEDIDILILPDSDNGQIQWSDGENEVIIAFDSDFSVTGLNIEYELI